jgi:heme-degrading monooxygenase HmoA
MFARRTRMRLKPNVESDFRLAYEHQITPILRDQEGFLEELVLATPARSEVLAISLWEEKKSADAFRAHTYPEVAKIIAKFTKGPLVVEDLTVEYTTYRKLQPAPAIV